MQNTSVYSIDRRAYEVWLFVLVHFERFLKPTVTAFAHDLRKVLKRIAYDTCNASQGTC